ncbi:MAG TPA: MOSC domain-containing protein [Stellaceae bacterium]|nr:MOSC domain-containing protein [Stellaceae bacterium]
MLDTIESELPDIRCVQPAHGGHFVVAVSRSPGHTLTKANRDRLSLIAGLGIDGDVHQGETLKQSFRRLRFGSQPNLRQIHLIHAELHDELRERGFEITAGQMGENITTRGIDLLGLPTGARLHIGLTVVIEITGLRHPCGQLNRIQPGLMKATLERDATGKLVRKAGVFALALRSGDLQPGDTIGVELPRGPHRPLAPV